MARGPSWDAFKSAATSSETSSCGVLSGWPDDPLCLDWGGRPFRLRCFLSMSASPLLRKKTACQSSTHIFLSTTYTATNPLTHLLTLPKLASHPRLLMIPFWYDDKRLNIQDTICGPKLRLYVSDGLLANLWRMLCDIRLWLLLEAKSAAWWLYFTQFHLTWYIFLVKNIPFLYQILFRLHIKDWNRDISNGAVGLNAGWKGNCPSVCYAYISAGALIYTHNRHESIILISVKN